MARLVVVVLLASCFAAVNARFSRADIRDVEYYMKEVIIDSVFTDSVVGALVDNSTNYKQVSFATSTFVNKEDSLLEGLLEGLHEGLVEGMHGLVDDSLLEGSLAGAIEAPSENSEDQRGRAAGLALDGA